MNWENTRPERRIDGVDEFKVSETVNEVMGEMERSGWTQGEAEKFLKTLEARIVKNSEQLRNQKPFTTYGREKEQVHPEQGQETQCPPPQEGLNFKDDAPPKHYRDQAVSEMNDGIVWRGAFYEKTATMIDESFFVGTLEKRVEEQKRTIQRMKKALIATEGIGFILLNLLLSLLIRVFH